MNILSDEKKKFDAKLLKLSRRGKVEALRLEEEEKKHEDERRKQKFFFN